MLPYSYEAMLCYGAGTHSFKVPRGGEEAASDKNLRVFNTAFKTQYDEEKGYEERLRGNDTMDFKIVSDLTGSPRRQDAADAPHRIHRDMDRSTTQTSASTKEGGTKPF